MGNEDLQKIFEEQEQLEKFEAEELRKWALEQAVSFSRGWNPSAKPGSLCNAKKTREIADDFIEWIKNGDNDADRA